MHVGIIGLGDIATKAYLPILCNHKDVTPVLCTRNKSVLDSLCQKFRIQERFSDFRDLIKSQPDLITIHSATDTHYEIAKACLTENIPVFIDKPISYTYAECESLLDLAKAKNVPLFVGFNRRYAPLYSKLLTLTPVQALYQKNRYNQPDDARVFVFDDFIHVIDLLLQFSKGITQDLDIHSFASNGKLASVSVRWRNGESLFTAEMNRLNGIAQEQLQFAIENESWEIQNLSSGKHFEQNRSHDLGFSDWHNTLFKRGFVDMIDDVLLHIQEGRKTDYDSILNTHRLCEIIVQRIKT